MSTLFGKSVASTYKDLLQVSNNNIGVDDVVRYIEDGEGTRSALALSTDMVVLSGHLLPQVNSQVDLGSAERKFRHLFLSDNTIYIGDQAFNTTDITALKDLQNTATGPISAIAALAEGAAQQGDITRDSFSDDLLLEYDSIVNKAIASVVPDSSPRFENVTITGVLAGPEVMTIDPAAVGDNTGKVVIAGDLQVDGTTTVVNSTTVSTSGKTIQLANGATSNAESDGAGVYVSGSNATLKYSAGTDSWTCNKSLKTEGDISSTNCTIDNTANITQLDVSGDTNLNGELHVGPAFRVTQSGAIGGVAPNTIGQTVVWDGSKWVTGVNSGEGAEDREVPDGFVYSLQAGMSDYTINFQQSYTTPPSLSTNLQIVGGGEIIPYVITDVTNTNFSVSFAEVIPNSNYKLHITFGGRDVYWKPGALGSLTYDTGDVIVQNSVQIGGNLTVEGETTTINATELSIEDRNITLANNTNSQDLSGLNGQGGVTWGADQLVKFNYDSTKGFTFLANDDSLSNFVGIGTANPVRTLHVRSGDDNIAARFTSSDTAVQIELEDTVGRSYIEARNDFRFGNNEKELMRVTDQSRLGVNNNNPDTALHLNNNTSASTWVTLESQNGKYQIGTADSSGEKYFSIYDPDATHAHQLFIKNGKFGFNNTAPTATLDVVGSNDQYNSATFTNTSDTGYGIKTVGGGGGKTRYIADFRDKDGTSCLKIDGDNQVGIGVEDPSGTLHVNSGRVSGDLLRVDIAPTAAGNPAGVHITNTNANLTETSAYLKITDQAGNHKLRVNKSGKVGINTGTPESILHIDGDGDSDNYSSILKLGDPAWNASGGCGFSFHRRSSDGWAGMQINSNLDEGMAIMVRNTTHSPTPTFLVTADGTVTCNTVSTTEMRASSSKSTYHQAQELYLGGAVKWIQFYQREFTSDESFGHGQFEFEILCNGATSGQSNTSRVVIATKQQNNAKHHGVKYAESTCQNGGASLRIGYTYDATGGQYGGGVLKVYAKPGNTNETYQRMSFHCRSNQTAAAANGLVKIEDTGTGVDPAGLTEVGPDLCHASAGNINFGNDASLYADQALNPDSNSLFGSLGGTFGHVGMTLNVGSYTGPYTMHRFRNGNGTVGGIEISGTSTAYNTSSDYRLKENVVELQDAVDRVKLLKPSRFNFKADPDTIVDGFLAHEVQDVVPEAITGNKDETTEEQREITPAVLDENGDVVTEAVTETVQVPVYQGIDQSKLVPLLTAAIQQQQTMIDELKAQNEQLISRIETLENK